VAEAAWRPSVGDRVCVRAGIARVADADGLPHYSEEEGRVGTVADVRALLSAPHHVYCVRLDPPHPEVWMGALPLALAFRSYTADELEPLAAL
jgi:hypothetical protein